MRIKVLNLVFWAMSIFALTACGAESGTYVLPTTPSQEAANGHNDGQAPEQRLEYDEYDFSPDYYPIECDTEIGADFGDGCKNVINAQTYQDETTARHFGGFITPFFYENNILPFITYTFPTVPVMVGVAGRPPRQILIETELPRLTYWYRLSEPFEDGLRFFSQLMENSGFQRIYYMNVKLDQHIVPTESCIVYRQNNVYISIENLGEWADWLPGADAIVIRVALIGESNYGDSEHVQTDFFEYDFANYFGRLPYVPSFRHLIPKPVSIMVEGNRSMHTFVLNMHGKDIQFFMDEISTLLIDNGFTSREDVLFQREHYLFSIPGVLYINRGIVVALETITVEYSNHFVYLRVFSSTWL